MTWIVVSGSHCAPSCECDGMLVCSTGAEFDGGGLDVGGGELGTDALNAPSPLSLSYTTIVPST